MKIENVDTGSIRTIHWKYNDYFEDEAMLYPDGKLRFDDSDPIDYEDIISDMLAKADKEEIEKYGSTVVLIHALAVLYLMRNEGTQPTYAYTSAISYMWVNTDYPNLESVEMQEDGEGEIVLKITDGGKVHEVSLDF